MNRSINPSINRSLMDLVVFLKSPLTPIGSIDIPTNVQENLNDIFQNLQDIPIFNNISASIKYKIVNVSILNVSNARNIAYENSNGDWICYLDDDDSWFPNKLQIQIDTMESKGYKLSCTDGLTGYGSYNKCREFFI